MDPPPRSLLLGPPSTVRDLVGAVLGFEGLPVEVAARRPRPGGDVDAGAVVVLVNPAPADWEAARAHGGGIVLVAEETYDDGAVLDAVLRGADAVVSADASALELAGAVRAVHRGETLIRPHQTRRLAAAARHGRAGVATARRLTPREEAILASIERGESVKQTARSLGIATKTVENLQSRLFRKLGARNRAHAVALAHHLGLRQLAGTAAPERGAP